MRYRHVIWDFDGTLFDTYPVMAAAFQDALRGIGVQESVDRIAALMKVTLGHAVAYYREKCQIDEAFLERYHAIRAIEEEQNIGPFPGIEGICRAICQCGGGNYLYTHRGASAIHFIHKFDLDPYFSELITAQQHFPRKPSPDAILYLIRKYDMEPDEVMMIGDRDLDMASAKNAGVHTCFFADTVRIGPVYDYAIGNFSELYAILGVEP